MEETLRKLVDPNNEACCDYHLMAKCKEWALKQGYLLYSVSNSTEGACFINLHTTGYDKHIISDSEQQAVFDACQWILENKDGKEESQ